MVNTELLYKVTKESKCIVDLKNRLVIIQYKNTDFGSNSLNKITSHLKWAKKHYGRYPFTLKIDIDINRFLDKVPIIILNILIYDIIRNTKLNIVFDINFDPNIVPNRIYFFYPLFTATDDNGNIDKDKFVNEMEKSRYYPIDARTSKNSDILNEFAFNEYIRIYISREDFSTSFKHESNIMSEITYFIKQHFDEIEYSTAIPEIVSELVGNVREHSDGDCLIDVNVIDLVRKEDNSNMKNINIAVLNLSSNRIFDRIMDNIDINAYNHDDSLYSRIYGAYSNHKTFFDKKYEKEDFFLITSFQYGVTSRDLISELGGGTGLNTLIRKLSGISNDEYSYLLSGYNIIFFKQEYLGLDEDNFCGFNKEKNYYCYKPEQTIIDRSSFYFPGTVHHLSFYRRVDNE